MTPFEVTQESVNFTAKTLRYCFLWNSKGNLTFFFPINVSFSASYVSFYSTTLLCSVYFYLLVFLRSLVKSMCTYVYLCHGPFSRFGQGPLLPAKGNVNVTAYNDSLDQCLPTWGSGPLKGPQKNKFRGCQILMLQTM